MLHSFHIVRIHCGELCLLSGKHLLTDVDQHETPKLSHKDDRGVEQSDIVLPLNLLQCLSRSIAWLADLHSAGDDVEDSEGKVDSIDEDGHAVQEAVEAVLAAGCLTEKVRHNCLSGASLR